MPTAVDDKQVTKICADLTRMVAQAVKSGDFPPEQLAPVCREIESLLDSAKTIEDLTRALTDMTMRYPLFASVLSTLQKQQQAGFQVEQMFQRNVRQVKSE